MPLLPNQDACSSCGAVIVRSFATFEPLPVVEFELADGITDEEAATLLASEPTSQPAWYASCWLHSYDAGCCGCVAGKHCDIVL